MYVVGITACPTGIAHTYMAQESLEKELEKRGWEYKIETQGSIGIENQLDQDEVDRADMIILCVSIQIEEQERFDGKKVFYGDVDECISFPNRVVDKALDFYNMK
ncbi:PTS fructose transporter subunit IIB [Faecalicoccus pleomorphus]|uniref:PTS fructose transporter subunit IIB n=1 Tax=Faecalicoccus pleomorphus TaxID=1323 RepID=UPI0022E10D48|nr:PTS fructose transporter subunit IIB [Faecalicoccus pleomorphus]